MGREYLKDFVRFHPLWTAFAVVAALVYAGWEYDHRAYAGQVIDGSTGLPLKGVFVIGQWSGFLPLPVEQRGGCYQLRVTQTDAQGRYRMPHLSWTLGGLLSVDKSHSVFFYYRRYVEEVKGTVAQADKPKTARMVPDPQSTRERLWFLSSQQNSMLCSSPEVWRAQLPPVYEAMLREAVSIAKSRKDWVAVAYIRANFNLVDHDLQEIDQLEKEASKRWDAEGEVEDAPSGPSRSSGLQRYVPEPAPKPNVTNTEQTSKTPGKELP